MAPARRARTVVGSRTDRGKERRMRVEEHLQRWLSAGLVTAEQAERLRAHEAAEPSSRGTARLAEALGYVGGSLALVALLVVVEQFWADLQVWGQATLLGLLTVALLGAGAWLRDSAERSVQRLTSVLWFLSAAAFAGLVGVVGDGGLDWSQTTTAFAVGVGTSVYAGALWRARPTALQQIALAVGAVTAVASGLELRDDVVDFSFVGLAVWGLGIVWALLTWGGLLRPRVTGFALGALGALVGTQMLAFSDLAGWGHALGLLTAAAMVAASVALGEVVLLAFGTVGAFLFVSETVFRYFGDTLGVPIALFLVGVALVAAALVITRLRPRVAEVSRG
jgi:hypothetical protein